MNIFKELFGNMENLLNLLKEFDYSKLILVFIFTFIVYLIHNLLVSRISRKKINKTKIGMKKINLEAELSSKRKNLFKFYIIISIFISLLIISKDNLTLVIPVLSALIILSIFSMKEQLNNVFLGLLYKSAVSTTIYEGMKFYFKDNPNEVCKISKVNLFKTIYKNEKTGQLNSIENKFLNQSHIIHKALKQLDYVEFKYMVRSDYPIEEYISNTRKLLNDYISNIEVDFKELREYVFTLKSKYNTTPFLKPFYDIDLKYLPKEELEITISLTTYKYNYDEHLDDMLKYRPIPIVKEEVIKKEETSDKKEEDIKE